MSEFVRYKVGYCVVLRSECNLKLYMNSDLAKQSLTYVDLVWKTIDRWYEGFAEFTPNLIVGVIVFLFFLMTSKYMSNLAVRVFHKFFPKKQETVKSLVGFFRFLIMLIGTFISLEIMGLSGFLWKFIGSLGVAGVIAGVALKDLVSSIFSGLLVGMDKAFKVGDYISIAGYSGTVHEIGFLTTKMITDDGKKVYIPNQVIFSAPFYNISASPQRRIILEYDIPADEDIHKARTAVLEALKKIEGVDKISEVDVNFTSVSQGVFSMQVRFWMQKGANIVKVKSDALLSVKEYLDKGNIRLVTPTSINITNTTAPAAEN